MWKRITYFGKSRSRKRSLCRGVTISPPDSTACFRHSPVDRRMWYNSFKSFSICSRVRFVSSLTLSLCCGACQDYPNHTGDTTHRFGVYMFPLNISLNRLPALARILLQCHTKLRIRLGRMRDYRGCGILGRWRGHEPSRLRVLMEVRHLMIVRTGQGVL